MDNMRTKSDSKKDADTESEGAIVEILKQELIATKNSANPFDLMTSYGQYACIQAVLQRYNNKLELYRLVHKPAVDPMQDAAALQFEYSKWEQEVDMMVQKKSKFELQPTPTNQQDAISKAEAMLSNPKYQPSDYSAACAALEMDPGHPRLPGMTISYAFKPWQVTGIHRILEMYHEPYTKAVLLADATGLGKTHEILGFWHQVS
jgi:hypothetical protein